MRIYKYSLGNYPSTVELSVPRGGTVRSVGEQDGVCQMWIEVDPDAPDELRRFEVVGTGHDIPLLANVYRGTVMVPPFVWHIYEYARFF